MGECWKMFKVKPPNGKQFFVAVIVDDFMLSTRDGKWATEQVLSVADLVFPSQTLYNWDVDEVDASEAPELPA